MVGGVILKCRLYEHAEINPSRVFLVLLLFLSPPSPSAALLTTRPATLRLLQFKQFHLLMSSLQYQLLHILESASPHFQKLVILRPRVRMDQADAEMLGTIINGNA